MNRNITTSFNDEGKVIITVTEEFDKSDMVIGELPKGCGYCPVGFMSESCGRKFPMSDDYENRPESCKLKSYEEYCAINYPRIIKNWEELALVKGTGDYILEIDAHCGCGWIRPKVETKETKERYGTYHIYMSTHTFYHRSHCRYISKVLQEHGFNVILQSWEDQ